MVDDDDDDDDDDDVVDVAVVDDDGGTVDVDFDVDNFSRISRNDVNN